MDDKELIQQFESRSLTLEQWTHRAHVRIAFCYLQKHSFDEAINCIRRGIKALNATFQIPETATSGYNETTTVAFTHLIAATMAAYGAAFPTPDSESFCETHPHLMHRSALRLFYSPQQRMQPDAKSKFVEPDLAPFPKLF